MDKKNKIIAILLITLSIFTNTIYLKNGAISANDAIAETESTYKEKLIRFHVLANSDSLADQELKLKVRDQVIESMNDKFKASSSIEETRTIVLENIEAMKNTALEVIEAEGKNYPVEIKLEPHNFPTKTYGNFTLPAGEYEAVRILIGEAKGENWWCVMFPPLCFVDTNNAIVDSETDQTMKKHLTQEEYNEISTQGEKGDKIVLKSIVLEKIKEWL